MSNSEVSDTFRLRNGLRLWQSLLVIDFDAESIQRVVVFVFNLTATARLQNTRMATATILIYYYGVRSHCSLTKRLRMHTYCTVYGMFGPFLGLPMIYSNC